MTIENYRKKPVVIEAVQWTGANLREIITFTDGPPDTRSRHAGMAWENYEDLVRRDGLKIFTLEGAMLAAPGDWIIKGVRGEFYPCKPDIFAATYEPASALRREREPVKVKPLVWVHGAKFCGQDHSYADTELGTWCMTAYSGRGGRWAYTDVAGNDSEDDWLTRDECQAAAQADYEARILAALEPDPTALAIVAAAYRDAAGVLDDPGDNAATAALGRQLCCNGQQCGCHGADVGAYLQYLIKQQTPSDATAALAAIERAAYERGVRAAAAKMAEPSMLGLTITKMEQCILALLTQEGR